MSSKLAYDALVVGGGINGLSALYHLGKMGAGKIGLIEQFRLGNVRGSSHGHSRVTRSPYVNEHYTKLVRVARDQEWPSLERDSDTKLIYHTPACFYGPLGGRYESYIHNVAASGVDAELLEPEEARRRFPLFRFNDAASVLVDRTAGIVAAAETLAALARLCLRSGSEIREETRVLEIDYSKDPIRVQTDRGPIQTERLIVTAGPWASRLSPFLKLRLKPARQIVGYFQLSGDPKDFRVGRFPVWASMGDGHYYGLPEFGCEGVKVARHITWGVEDDPDEEIDVTPEAVEALEACIRAALVPPVERFVRAETCFYTNTATEDFVIDLHPDNRNIGIGAGFTGHGFKFGPLTGRILSELVLHGKSSVPEFECARALFTVFGPDSTPD